MISSHTIVRYNVTQDTLFSRQLNLEFLAKQIEPRLKGESNIFIFHFKLLQHFLDKQTFNRIFSLVKAKTGAITYSSSV